MSPEEKSLLERTYSLTQENNKILISMRRHARIGTAIKAIYWILIIGLSFGAYYFIQPFIQALTGGLYGNGDVEQTSSVGDIQSRVSQIQDLLK